MSAKMRGSEIALRIAVDGVVQGGSLFKVTNFTATARTDLTEDDYLGEKETDLDIQHHGWDLGFEIDLQDEKSIELCDEIIQREIDNETHPDITITALYSFREPGARAKIIVYHEVFLKMDEETAGGRKEKVKGKYSGKCKRRTTLNA